MSGKRVEQLRAQGERTRERLLEVARSALASDSGTSLNAIAKTAGVGIGTLYRHFATREDLVFAIYLDEVEELVASADDLAAELDPAAALRAWLDHYAQFVMAKAGLVDALRTASVHGRFSEEAYPPVTQAIERLLRGGSEAGAFRSDYDADDLLLATNGLYVLDPDADWAPRAKSLFDLIVAGLRPPGPAAGSAQPKASV